MARIARVCPPDSVVHVVNRGVERRRLFERPRDYEQFLELIDRTLERRTMRVLAYSVMPNHWHLVLWPGEKRDLSRFLHYLTSLHAARIRYSSATAGAGHVYQSRYHSSLRAC
jgi:putative transposase